MLRLVSASLAALTLSLAAPAFAGETAAPAAPADPAAAAQKITFTNKLVGDKKTWLPEGAKVSAGKPLEITLVNTLADPHGFSAPGLTDAFVVKGNETKTITVAAPKAGTYKFLCQLHPKHVGGSIEVTP